MAWRSLAAGLLVTWLLSACSPPQVTQSQVTVAVTADGKALQLQIAAGSTVQDVLNQAGINLTELDRVQPAVFTVVSEGVSIKVTRVTEAFDVEQVIIPYEQQVVRSETLPEGESRLSQPGANGVQENTYRTLFEDGVEVSRSIVRTVTIQEAVPEITLVGSQTPFLSLPIPGRLVYLLGGNAWVMEETTGNRRPLVSTGDLDGRVFELSPDGKWLLYTRRGSAEDTINTLWAAQVEAGSTVVVDFKVENIAHSAHFAPDSSRVVYSSVEPRAAAPGWQANNDLNQVSVSSSGFTNRQSPLLEANSGGVYGWWGTMFRWGPLDTGLAFARPDSIGLVNETDSSLITLAGVLPLQTGGDWAWVPGTNWSPDGKFLYTVAHIAPEGSSEPETSQQFDLVAVPVESGPPITLATQVGMFAYPVPSPLQPAVRADVQVNDYLVAYLQAIFPAQSETSRYRLVVVDRDGSNRRVLFPAEGEQGISPQEVVWSPRPMNADGSFMIALVHQENIWLVNLQDGQAQQITGDGFITRIDWR